jgi:hypothetical protein
VFKAEGELDISEVGPPKDLLSIFTSNRCMKYKRCYTVIFTKPNSKPDTGKKKNP